MASHEQVREYLAYWFQLGKRVVIQNGQDYVLPQPVIRGDRYSPEFEACWEKIISAAAGDCYLEGTEERISDLLTNEWEITSCARCTMPLAMRYHGMPCSSCPCSDLHGWPNTEVPLPRSPINSNNVLSNIYQRVFTASHRYAETKDERLRKLKQHEE